MSDLISRQAAIDALGEAPEVWMDTPEEFAALNQWEMDVTAIKAVPSAEPKIGRWENVAMYTVECSECKAQLHELEYTNFCPNCGARMVGEDGE